MNDEKFGILKGGLQLVLGSIVSILAIAYGATNLTNECTSDFFSFDLARYLIVGGSVGLVANGLLSLLFCVSSCSDSCLANPPCVLFSTVIAVLAYLFSVAWFVIGVLFLASIQPECRSETHSLWAMTVAYVVLHQGRVTFASKDK